MNTTHSCRPNPLTEQIETERDYARQVHWCWMRARPRPCFNPELLEGLRICADDFSRSVNRGYAQIAAGQSGPAANQAPMPRYWVSASKTPGVFSLGGDLALFAALVQRKDRELLLRYATACIDHIVHVYQAFDRPVLTVALVQGQALGGGFELALAHDVIIAEASASFGLPEIGFNAFPGMGAYSFLSRKIGPVEARRLILRGQRLSAQELHDMGVVDHVVKDGEGRAGVHNFVTKSERSWRTRLALYDAQRLCARLSRGELDQIVRSWVDCVLALGPLDVRRMQRLAALQLGRFADRGVRPPPVASANASTVLASSELCSDGVQMRC